MTTPQPDWLELCRQEFNRRHQEQAELQADAIDATRLVIFAEGTVVLFIVAIAAVLL